MKPRGLVVAGLLAVLMGDTAQSQKFDILVQDRAIVQRCSTQGLPRSIAVGMPGGFSYVFDPVACRLAFVWFGGFLDFRPEATGRGGGRLPILGTKRSVGTAESPLRIGAADQEPMTIEFDGYRREVATGIPTFQFRVDGVPIEQRVLSFGRDQVTVELSFASVGDAPRFYCLDPKATTGIAVSDGVQVVRPGVIEIPAEESWAQIRLSLPHTAETFARQQPTTNGRLLYAIHCMACHTLDGGKRIGPSFNELWSGPRVVTRNGRSEEVVADEAYIRESILKPQAAIVQGYEKANQMINITQTLDVEQIDALVKFLVSLRLEGGK
jgi:mono/diheme cytochrome c family protein